MLFNKLILAYKKEDNKASENLFLLQKDALVIESQLVVYASPELVDAFYDFKNFIIQIPKEDFLKKWSDVYQKGHKYLLLCRQDLATGITESFKSFEEKLTKEPPTTPEEVTVETNALGGFSTDTSKF